MYRHGDASPDDAVVGNVELAVRVNRFSVALQTSRSAQASSTDTVLDFAVCLETLVSRPCAAPLLLRLGCRLPRPTVATVRVPTAAVYLSTYRPASTTIEKANQCLR